MHEFKYMFCGLFVVCALLFTPSVKAQFAGDLFFADPSVAIPEGEQGTLEVQVFSGSDTFGAAQFDLVFDPERIEVVSVRPGNVPELHDGLTFVQSEGRVSIIVVNSGSLDVPFGTSSLAEIEVRPLTAAGSVISVGNQVEEVLRQDSTPYAFSAGLGAEVVVTDAAAHAVSVQSESSEPVEVEPGSDLHNRILAMRRPGSVVTLIELDEDHRAHALRVKAAGDGSEGE